MSEVKKVSAAAQHNVQAAAPAMAAVRPAHSSDARGMARGGEPIVNRGADSPALDRGSARAVMPGDEQQDPVAG